MGRLFLVFGLKLDPSFETLQAAVIFSFICYEHAAIFD